MFRTASGASPFFACERPWDAVWWKALLPLAILGLTAHLLHVLKRPD
jgi:hypothetical protein